MSPASGSPGLSADGSILDHLRELRGRVIKCLLIVAIGFVVAFNFSEQILNFLIQPLADVLPDGQTLIFTGLPDAFLVNLKTGIWGGIFLTAPLWLYQVWAFVAPGLYRSEKKKIMSLVSAATILLFLGAAFGYWLVFPLAFKFFVSFSSGMLTAMPALGPYFSLVMALLLAFGLVFQLPLVILFLADLGLVNSIILTKGRKYAILIIFILAAILTPPDVISQCLMAAPMLILYEISLKLVKRNEKRRVAGEVAEEVIKKV